jgi:hypothetical protein
VRSPRFVLTAALLFTVASILNCSKKAATPVAPPNPPACSVTPSSLDFGSATVGSSADRSFTVKNAGGGTLAGTATTSSPGYAVISGGSYSLGAGQQATVTVRFTPTSAGAAPGTIALSGPGCGSVVCNANGVPSGPVCQLSAGFLSFDPIVGACASSDRALGITNAGTGVLSGTVISPCPAFQIVGNPSYSLGAGQTATITIRFSPGTYGSFSCWVRTGCDSVYCSGSIQRQSICGTVSPDVLDFGTVYVGQTVTMGATLTAGNMPFELQWVSQGDPNFDSPPGVADVLAYDSFSCQVKFHPQTAGLHSAWFAGQCRQKFGGDGDYHPFACITARGNAVVAAGTPACQLSTTSISFGIVAVGSSVDQTVTVTNAGGGVLNGVAAVCSPFTVLGDPSISLGPSQSKTLTVRFTPTQHGIATSCYLQLSSACSNVYVTGQGQ